MGWAITGLGVAVVIAVVAGAALLLCKRYCGSWQWGARNVWSICEEWRQTISWLWAPREEKVGLVKAQHPTPQTIPGLYRQTGNSSQHLLHSDSDLRLDAQGAFTRFEPVDRDLHPPLGTAGNTIPPQPLRPAPQPETTRPTARPRPPPLHTTPSTVEYLRMQESGPGPLTPPPSLQRGGLLGSRSNAPSAFLFQREQIDSYNVDQQTTDHSPFRYDTGKNTMPENIQMTAYNTQMDAWVNEEKNKEGYNGRYNPYSQFDTGIESTIRYGVHGVPLSSLDGKADDDSNISYGSYDIVQRSHMIRQHVRNDSRGSQSSFGMTNSSNAASQTIRESIFGPGALSKMAQSSQSLVNELDRTGNDVQGIEMTPFRSLQDDINTSFSFRDTQGFQRVSQYIEGLPDLSGYDSLNELEMYQDSDKQLFSDAMQDELIGLEVNGKSVPSPVPPPPAPPDPPRDTTTRSEPTTGERIFSTLRSVTSKSYINASEFYNSVFSSAHQLPATFYGRTQSSNNINSSPIQEIQDMYDSDVRCPDGTARSSDLYNPELNFKARRTAREVYDSLQNPPSSPLLIKGHSPEMENYMSDPSFNRTSEDIFNSLEQGRKNMGRLNGSHDYNDPDEFDILMKRNNYDFHSTTEELHRKWKLRQTLEETLMNHTMSDYNELSTRSRRGSQGSELDSILDESDMKRAISCNSVCSDISGVLNDIDDKPVCRVGLEYQRLENRGTDNKGRLSVSVFEVKGYIEHDSHQAHNTFARVYLLPEKNEYLETKLIKVSSSLPSWTTHLEKFEFPLNGSTADRTLLVQVFSIEPSSDTIVSLIGEGTLRLESTWAATTTWVTLSDPTRRLGELMFSLIYCPVAEKLNVIVVRAKNLRGSVDDYFVEVYMLEQGRKTYKGTTSVKRGEKSPVFNDAISFNVTSQMLQDIQLRLTVAEVSSEGACSKAHSIGHVTVGPKSTGNALQHWRLMLSNGRRRATMWHPLRT